MPEGSPAARRQLGSLLRKLREDAGKTVQAVGDAKVAGATKVWRIESGKTLPSVSDVLGLCWLYGADPSTTKRLTDMIVELTQSTGGWWESYGENVPSWLSVYVGMEQTATTIQAYEPEFVYGLVQTPRYAFAATPRSTTQRRTLRSGSLGNERSLSGRTRSSCPLCLGKAP